MKTFYISKECFFPRINNIQESNLFARTLITTHSEFLTHIPILIPINHLLYKDSTNPGHIAFFTTVISSYLRFRTFFPHAYGII